MPLIYTSDGRLESHSYVGVILIIDGPVESLLRVVRRQLESMTIPFPLILSQ